MLFWNVKVGATEIVKGAENTSGEWRSVWGQKREEAQVWSLGRRFLGEGNGNPLQYSCLENPMERGAWQTTVHGLAKSQTRLSGYHSYSLKAFPWISSRKTSRLSHESSRLFSSIRVFSSDSTLCIMWPKYWSFSFSISPPNEYSELISFRIDWFDLLELQGAFESLLQTTVKKHQFFSTQSSLWFSSHIHKRLPEKP